MRKGIELGSGASTMGLIKRSEEHSSREDICTCSDGFMPKLQQVLQLTICFNGRNLPPFYKRGSATYKRRVDCFMLSDISGGV